MSKILFKSGREYTVKENPGVVEKAEPRKEEHKEEGMETLSCEIPKFKEQMCSPGRKGVSFVGKEFPGTEPFIDALSNANDQGFFDGMELGIIAVDSEQCDRLAEHEKVDVLPTVNVYEKCEKLGSVTPAQDDANKGYRKTVEKLIDLSPDED